MFATERAEERAREQFEEIDRVRDAVLMRVDTAAHSYQMRAGTAESLRRRIFQTAENDLKQRVRSGVWAVSVAQRREHELARRARAEREREGDGARTQGTQGRRRAVLFTPVTRMD